MKKRFRAMHHQIEQLREEIKEKDTDLIKGHIAHHKVNKDMEKIKDLLDKTKKRQVKFCSMEDAFFLVNS